MVFGSSTRTAGSLCLTPSDQEDGFEKPPEKHHEASTHRRRHRLSYAMHDTPATERCASQLVGPSSTGRHAKLLEPRCHQAVPISCDSANLRSSTPPPDMPRHATSESGPINLQPKPSRSLRTKPRLQRKQKHPHACFSAPAATVGTPPQLLNATLIPALVLTVNELDRLSAFDRRTSRPSSGPVVPCVGCD